MPQHLVILRHGKAERDSPSRGDDDRALQPRGRYQAQFVAAELRPSGYAPTLIIASPILRARTTAEIVAGELGVELLIDERLGTRHDEQDHLACAREHITGEHASVMLVGHNPTLSTLAAQLIDTGSTAATRPISWRGELRTGEALVLESPVPIRLNAATLLRAIRLDHDD